MSIARYEASRIDAKAAKRFMPYAPRKAGGWWLCSPRSDQLPDDERRRERYPLYNLPSVLDQIRHHHRYPDLAKRQIWLVEGEKVSNVLSKIAPPNGSPPVVCALCGGSKNPLDHHDLTPLYGQKVLIMADADKGGRAWAKKVGKHLHENEALVRYHMPPGEEGIDGADAAAAGGWQGLLDYIENTKGIRSHEEVFPIKEHPTPRNDMGFTDYFRVMGFEGDRIVIQNRKTHRLHKIGAAGIANEGNLIHLAPLSYWLALSGDQITAANRRVWADGIIRAAEREGEISTQRTVFWGRGAVKDRSEVFYHIGTALLREDHRGALARKEPLVQDVQSSICIPGPEIRLVDDERAPIFAADLHEAVMGYRWEKDEHGAAFLGWVVTSIIGGALPFRPMLWLTAPHGTGKTFLLEEVLKNVFGEIVTDLANATEAGMAAVAADASLPCYLDEFEPEKGRERQQQAILGLVRMATSGGGARIRGTADSGFTTVRPRFSLLMSSIDRPLLKPADHSRITPIRLSLDPVDNWIDVRDRIREATKPERCKVIRTWIIRNAIRIIDSAAVIEDQLIRSGAATRDAQIRGALSAGVRFLSGKPDFLLVPQAGDRPDSYGPMAQIMSALLRRAGGEDMTLGEILTKAYFHHR